MDRLQYCTTLNRPLVKNFAKAFAKKIIRRTGWDVTKLESSFAEDLVLSNLLHIVQPVAILDVGANTGQYADFVRRCGYRGLLVSFEAAREAHAHLMRRATDQSRWSIAPLAAVGSHSGSIEMNIAGNSVSSSILPMRRIHEEAAPQSRYVATERVPLDTLDNLASPLIPGTGPLFLKIDTQGYEKEVLSGAAKLLPRIGGIQLELSLTELYEGAPTFAEMLSLLTQLRFELHAIAPGFRDQRSGQLLQIDGFFVSSHHVPQP